LQNQLSLIDSGFAVDDRGDLLFCNGFDLEPIRRFYVVTNHRRGFIRAWHGHRYEAKYVLPLDGAALFAGVAVQDWERPDPNAYVERLTISAKRPQVLFIPPGFAHGFMTLGENTRLMFFSTATLEESANDDYRFHARFWDPWHIEER
jgi:dTDP-4-dehydrorhamnose 3,5-epimerase-like enzyme